MTLKQKVARFWLYVRIGWLVASRWFSTKFQQFTDWVETNKEKGKQMQKEGWNDLQNAFNNRKK